MSHTRKSRVSVLILLAMMSIPSAFAASGNKPAPEDPIFAGADQLAHGAIKTTEVNLGPDMLQMANKMSNGEMMKDGPAWMREAKYIYVRAFEYAKPGQYKMADIQKFVNRLQGHGWMQMVKVSKKDKITEICVRSEDNGESKEIVVIAAKPTKLTLIHVKGPASMSVMGQSGQPGGQSSTDPGLKKRAPK